METNKPVRRLGKPSAERDAAKRLYATSRFMTGEFDAWPEERDAALAFLRTVRSATTIGTYSSNLVQLFRWSRAFGVRPFELRRSQARAYEAELSNLSECSRDARCVAARSFFNHVLDDDDPPIKSNPFHRVGPRSPKPKKQTPALEQEQLEELFAYLVKQRTLRPAALITHRDFAMIYLMARVGPRRITTSHLHWEDVNTERGLVLLQLHLKGNRYQKIELPDDVVAVLAAWFSVVSSALGRPPRPDDAIFPPLGPHLATLRGYDRLEPLDPNGISYVVSERLKAIGIKGKGWSAHAMRATAATIANEEGASLEEIQAMLCHLNRNQTEGYIRRARPKRSAARHWTPRIAKSGQLGHSMTGLGRLLGDAEAAA